MRSRPEKIAQGLLAVFAKGVVGSDGLVLREIASGIGFVDVGVSFGGVLHLIELKILASGTSLTSPATELFNRLLWLDAVFSTPDP